jgi:hypothetical protein
VYYLSTHIYLYRHVLRIYPRALPVCSRVLHTYLEYCCDLHASLNYESYTEFHLPPFDQPENSLHKWTHPIYVIISCYFTIYLNIILQTSLRLLSDLLLSGFPTELLFILRYLKVRQSTSTTPVQDVQNLTGWSSVLTILLLRPIYVTLFISPVLCPASLFQSGRSRKTTIVNKEIGKHVNYFEISEIFRYNFRRSWKENN